MSTKIQGFDYSSSIIHKIDSSKFIHSFQAKVSFILQYTCILERYFSKNFLSSLREKLMMENTIAIKSITSEDLNPQHYSELEQSRIHESSFTSNNSMSRLSSTSNKMVINNQFSISEFVNSNTPNKGKTTTAEYQSLCLPSIQSKNWK
jgi:hypothetical protein